jgi:hypothetical protein
VHLVGAAKQTTAVGSNPNLLGTLSAAASPKRVVYAIVHTFSGTYADIAINPNGQIGLINPRPPAVKLRITRSSHWRASPTSREVERFLT